MENKKLLERIVLNPKIMAGKPIIQGTRLTVDFILNLLPLTRVKISYNLVFKRVNYSFSHVDKK